MPILGTGSRDWRGLDSKVGGLRRAFSSSEEAMEPRHIAFAFVIMVGWEFIQAQQRLARLSTLLHRIAVHAVNDEHECPSRFAPAASLYPPFSRLLRRSFASSCSV